MGTALYFDASKDDGGMFPGVPKRDLTDEEFEALPKWLQASVEASPMYRRTNPSPAPRKAVEKKEET
jgi:hypothetical protein